ncbi:MAG: rod shape-determining protein RodA [Clostridia bacterium]|nr:rod shape-determining protein RodA [Clostridia bacterium]
MRIGESRHSRAHVDWVLIILVFTLSAFGVLAVTVATFSTTSVADDNLLNNIVSSYYGQRQGIFFFVSMVAIGVMLAIPYELIRRYSMLIYIGACGLLGVALAGEAAGVKAWIDIIWGYTLQPSEFVKLACIVVTAKYLENTNNPMGTFRDSIRIALLVGFPWLLTLAQGEMGSVIVMVFVFAVMMFFGGIRYRIIAGVAVVAVLAVALVMGYALSSGSDSYRLMRILSFIDPSVDEAASYQVSQSKIAIGSGGWDGIGTFVPGSFSQLDYVPEDWTDFIFSTIGEAFGFVGCALVILCYLAIILRMLYLAMYTHNRFGQMCIIGVMAMMLFHVLENVGMTTGLTPVTGIPLPFLSYGGSNLLTNMVGIGLVLNVVRNRSITHVSEYGTQIFQIAKPKEEEKKTKRSVFAGFGKGRKAEPKMPDPTE